MSMPTVPAGPNLFTPIDWMVVAAYLAAMLWMGVALSKRQTSTRSYFLGNKDVSWITSGLSIVATETSALTFIGVPAMSYFGNCKFIQIVIGYVIARVVVAFFMLPRYFEGQEIYSPYELLSRRFGVASRTVSVVFFLVAGILAAGVRVYVTAIPLTVVLGLDIFTCILIFLVSSLVYTYLGGLTAVIWTDVAQFVIFVFGGLFALFYLPTVAGGGFGGIMERAAQAGKLEWLDTTLSLGGEFNLWMGVIGGTFISTVTHGSDQLILQRVLACRSRKDGQKAMLLSGVIILPMFLTFLLIGIMLWVFYQDHAFGIAPRLDAGGKPIGDYIFPIFIVSEMPVLVKGILISAILAAAMSSISSALSAFSSTYVMNIHKAFFRADRPEAHYLWVSRMSILVFGLLLLGVAYLSKNVKLVFNLAFQLSGITSGAVLGGLLFAILNRRARSQVPVIAAMIVSSLVMLGIQLACTWKIISVQWPWYGMIGTTTTLFAAWLVSRFTKRDRDA